MGGGKGGGLRLCAPSFFFFLRESGCVLKRAEGREKISDLILNVIVEEANYWKECQRKSLQTLSPPPATPPTAALNPIRSSMRVTSRGRHAAAGWGFGLGASEWREDAEAGQGGRVGRVQASSTSSEGSYVPVRPRGEQRSHLLP